MGVWVGVDRGHIHTRTYCRHMKTKGASLHKYVHTEVGVAAVPRGDLYKGDDHTIINVEITQKCTKMCVQIYIGRY